MNAVASSVSPTRSVAGAGLGVGTACAFALIAVISFHLAYAFSPCSLLIVVFLYALVQLTRLGTARQAFYFTLVVGLAIYAPELSFFWTLFQIGAVPLWVILSCWLAAFVVLGRACLTRLGPVAWTCAAPFVWMGLEYFRSELYYLRFSWLNVGYVFSQTSLLHYFSVFGVYGIGFVLMAVAATASLFPSMNGSFRIAAVAALAVLFAFPLIFPKTKGEGGKTLRVAGIQFEFATPAEIRSALESAIKTAPDTDIFVLSEYSFNGPIPELVKKWCRKNGKYLIAGGEDPLPNGQYYNVAYVVAPDGSIAFQQAKCVPVQLMKDGLAAKRQDVWNSPWGRIGLCICYDASYTRVTDELVRKGAQAFIIPTMDVIDWGRRQHELHGRIGAMRAAEYGLPIFRLCSSGISQIISASGGVISTAPYPAPGALISGEMSLADIGGRIPPDRYLALISSVFTGALALWLLIAHWRLRAKAK